MRWVISAVDAMVNDPPLPPRREETLDFCNGWKWSKPPPPNNAAFVPRSRAVIARRIISWRADGGGGRFHGEGTRVVLVLLCSFHSNYPEPFQAQNSGGGPFL